MDFTNKYVNSSPETAANFLSKLFYCWLLPFLKFGYENDLQVKDIYNPVSSDQSDRLGNILERNWLEEVKTARNLNRKPDLQKSIGKTFWKPYFLLGLLLFLQCIFLRLGQPIILRAYIAYFDKPIDGAADGWFLAFVVVLMAFLNVVIMHFASLSMQRIGMRCRIACCSLVYRKVLKLSKYSLGEIQAGQLINLLSNDVQRFDIASVFFNYIWIMPIQAVLAAYILYDAVGVAALPGLLAITIQAVPLQGYLSKMQGKMRYKIAQKTDQRVRLMNEIVAGIQVIKMYTWEKPFEKMIQFARKLEVNNIVKTSYIKGISLALMVFTERVTLFLTIITFVLIGNPLTADVVFSVAQLFNTIQLYMSIFFPLAIATFAEAKVSIRRLENFLLNEELLNIDDNKQNENKEDIGSIHLVKANASWLKNQIVDTLIDLNLTVKSGTLCCITGSVGSGKSSFLQLLLKEMPLNTGKVSVCGKVSFASQEPWLFGSNVRNNILFGQEFVKSRYDEVVKVCALETDFKQFPYGDKTIVGDKGVSLSGGQRARINLARAIYRDADIYLLDDPMSAVDALVSKHLFYQCFKDYLKNKTRIIVTHQMQFLKEADVILVFNNGKIEKMGKFEELGKEDFINHEGAINSLDDQLEAKEVKHRERTISSNSQSADNSVEIQEPKENEESVEKGSLSLSLYKDYYLSGGSVFILIFLVFLLLIAQMSCNAGDMWLKEWTKVENMRSTSIISTSNESLVSQENDTSTNLINQTLHPTDERLFDSDQYYSQSHYIYIYTVFIILSMILTTARSLLFFKICMNASINLHNTMFANILQAPMRFFNINPSGRILNRFSKDIGAIDEILPRATLEAIQIFLVMSGILAMVFIEVPWMILPTVILAVLFYWCRTIYLSSAQDVKRLEGITKAPVFSYVTSTLNGLTTIRASDAQKILIKEFDQIQDQHTGTWFLFIANSETFGFYLDLISTIFLSMVTFQFLVFQNENTFSGSVGLVISQSLILTGMLQHGIRQSAEVASNMTSVERVMQYTTLDKEGPFDTPPNKTPPNHWPSNGTIKFKNISLRYAPDEAPVIKKLNVDISAGQKIGIVGRTGAGKSSIIASLFRLAPMEGTIEIDDIDISLIGLHDSRRKISIIPQEPILFSTSVRYNLDPFETHSDEDLWKALEYVQMKQSVEDLSVNINEGGSNFSAGQRQLICLARALVQKNKIIVMDEATANVDPQTDSLIQATIKTQFKDCTVLTIAHRLHTIMDYDKVLVMDSGEAVEFGHAHELLQNRDGVFSKMVEQTGTPMKNNLIKIAEQDFRTKYENGKSNEAENDEHKT